jgi:O-antigen/teichoic acid export membrane protein
MAGARSKLARVRPGEPSQRGEPEPRWPDEPGPADWPSLGPADTFGDQRLGGLTVTQIEEYARQVKERWLPLPDSWHFEPEPAAAPRRGRAPAPELAGRGRWRDGAPSGHVPLREVARGGALNLVGAVVSAIATLGVTVLVTRGFPKPVAGAFFAATSLFLMVESAANLGAFNGAVYFVARLRSLGEHSRIPAVLRTAIRPVAVASVLMTVALLLLANPLAHLLLGGHFSGHGPTSPAAVASALRALALTLPFAALLDTFLGASRGFHDMRPTVVVDRLFRSVAQCAGILLAVAVGTAGLLAPLWALPYVPAGIAGWLWLRRIRQRNAAAMTTAAASPEARPHGRVASKRLANANSRGFWRFTAPRALATLAQITIQRLDIVLVGILRGPAEAAVYTAATRFLVAGQLGNAALSNAAQPRFTALFAVGDRPGANAVYRVTTAWLVLLTWPLYLLCVVYGPAVLAVFGHSYRAGTTVMVILGLAMLVATACGQVDMVLTTTGRSSWSLANGLTAVTINVCLDLLLIPRYGITGAAIGWAAAIATTNLVPLTQVAALVRIHPMGKGTLIACALTAVSFGALPLAVRAVLGSGPLPSLAAVFVGCAIQAAGIWLFRDALYLAALPGMSRIRRSRNGRVE